ncbi:MAG: HDIG domain-containing protein [Candidatus Cloacimonetes bacterium]|nr:HDIG domain-containing protein [Candidatus Cloacimonadota bacterium]
MRSKHVLVAIITALCVAGLYQLILANRQKYPDYPYSAGQVAEYDILAPFDFPILKTDTQIQKEFELKLAEVGKPYRFSEDAEFEAYSDLNRLFDLIYESSGSKDPETAALKARQQGFELEEVESLLNLDLKKVAATHDAIKRNLETLYRAGIYEEIGGDSILVRSEKGMQKRSLSRFFDLDEAKRLALQRLDPIQASLVEANSTKLIKPNLVIDKQRYAEIQDSLKAGIEPVEGTLHEGEAIVRRGQKLGEEDINKLASLSQEYQVRGEHRSGIMQLLGFISLLAYFFAVVFAFNLNLLKVPLREGDGNLGVVYLNLGLLIQVLIALITIQLFGQNISLIPFGLVVLSTAILMGYEFGFLFSAFSVLAVAPFVNWDASGLAMLLASSLMTLALIRRYESRHAFFRIWIFQYLSVNLINGAVRLLFFTGENLTEMLVNLFHNAGYSMVSTSFVVLGTLGFVSFFERRWNRATKQLLLELQDFNTPLLKRLATSAVGTYHHSLIVGNLAEQAAEAIGANPLLARVGSYYHDIGKTVNPDIFTENNEDSSEFYEKLSPRESADIIRDHVREGVALAEKHGLPQAVIDFILQHHGTGYIRYFLDEAKRSGEEINLEDYQYPGPLPQTKETALVMLADVVESISKSKKEANEDEIAKLIDDTILRLIREGQFDEAPITVKDLALAKKAMLPILESVFRKRLEYPEEKKQ